MVYSYEQTYLPDHTMGGAQEYPLGALQLQQLAAARTVTGFGSQFWSNRRLLNHVGWSSVRQLVFYHTALQACKTISTGKPKNLYRRLFSSYPYETRSSQQTSSGKIKMSTRRDSDTGLNRVTTEFLQM